MIFLNGFVLFCYDLREGISVIEAIIRLETVKIQLSSFHFHNPNRNTMLLYIGIKRESHNATFNTFRINLTLNLSYLLNGIFGIVN